MLPTHFEQIARAYTRDRNIQHLFGVDRPKDILVEFLAQGEYNINFLLASPSLKAVLRLNTGSQMHLKNQIAYEYRTLELLAQTEVTPHPFYLDDSLSVSPYGMLVMEYIPGRWLRYENEYLMAADVFARVHSIKYHEDTGMIRADRPASAILDECKEMAAVYLNSSLGMTSVKKLLKKIITSVENIVNCFDEPVPAETLVLNNTEVNSSNFLIDEKNNQCKLVDWEKAIFSLPTQDLSHFLVPTTTLWKTDFRFTPEQVNKFIKRYCQLTGQPYGEILEQLDIFWPVTCLRGVSWCSMAFVEYQQSNRPLKNSFAFNKIQQYLEETFIKDIFKRII